MRHWCFFAEGHTLVVANQVVASLEELAETEETELWRTVWKVRGLLAERYRLDGFNIGNNEGATAGQTIGHAQIHLNSMVLV